MASSARTIHLVEHRFGTGEPFSLGVEEELCLVSPETGQLVNAAPEVLDRLTKPAVGAVEGEVLACQVELITGVCETVGEAMAGLELLQRAVVDTGVGLLGSGTHPSAEEGDARVTGEERYELISSLLGDAVATPVSALHVHVGMPDPETAIRVFNGLRRHLPLLEALAANAPFRHGRDTKGSARCSTREAGRGCSRWPTARAGWPACSSPWPDVATAELRP